MSKVMLSSSRKHLLEVNETYFEHQGVAFRYAGNCFKAGLMALIHGLIPGYFKTGASNLVKRLAAGRKDVH